LRISGGPVFSAAALLASVATSFLEMFVQHARMTNEAHSFGLFSGVKSNHNSTPRAPNMKQMSLNSSILFQNMYTYRPKLDDEVKLVLPLPIAMKLDKRERSSLIASNLVPASVHLYTS
jgi:hypothetical protein